MLNTIIARLMFALLIVSPVFALTPVMAEAATSSSSTVKGTASIDADTLLVESGQRASLTGTSTAAKLRVTITASSTDKTFYKSSSLSVRNGNWHVRVSKKLPDGTYTASVYQDVKGKLTLLTQGTLYVGVSPVTLRVTSIPLLTGGKAAPGSTVPISYLQVVNESDATTTIAGFWVREDGTAPAKAVIGLGSVDDRGNNRVSTVAVEGKTPFVGNTGYVPSGAVIGPHQMKLFTLKAQISAMSAQYAGTSLMLNVSGVDAPASFNATYPILGTTWVL